MVGGGESFVVGGRQAGLGGSGLKCGGEGSGGGWGKVLREGRYHCPPSLDRAASTMQTPPAALARVSRTGLPCALLVPVGTRHLSRSQRALTLFPRRSPVGSLFSPGTAPRPAPRAVAWSSRG